MYLLTQDRRELLQFSRVTISHTLGGKAILCAYTPGCDNTLNYVTIGTYRDEASAAAELLRITEALRSGVAVYEVN